MVVFNIPEERRFEYRLALLSFLLVIVVIGLGAYTRLVHAGLGCPDWPTCYGHLWIPNEAHEIEAANLRFADTPVETDKTWPEQIHRIFATSLGLCILVLAVLAIKNRSKGKPFKLQLLLLLFVILQGLFGMWTVTLKLWPQVVTAHLLGGFFTASLLWLLILRLNDRCWNVAFETYHKILNIRGWVIVGTIIVILQISLGGWTTSNYAAVACFELPTCHNNEWWPEMDFKQGFNVMQEVGPNYLGGQMDNPARTAIHMMHRMGAIITALYLIVLALKMLSVKNNNMTNMSYILLSAIAVQILLGLSNIYFYFPISVAVLHNLFGAILLLVMVTLCHRVFTARLKT